MPDRAALATALQSAAEVLDDEVLAPDDYRATADAAVEALVRHYEFTDLCAAAVAEGRTGGTLGTVQNTAILRHVARDLPDLIATGRVTARIGRQVGGGSGSGIDFYVDMGRADLCPSLWGRAGSTWRCLALTIPHSVVPVELWEDIYRRKGKAGRRLLPSAVPGAGTFRGEVPGH